MLDRTSADVHPWDATEAVKELHRRSYYPRSSRKKNPANENVGDCIGRWPEVLQACIQGGAELALSSFGAALFYLQRSLVGKYSFCISFQLQLPESLINGFNEIIFNCQMLRY